MFEVVGTPLLMGALLDRGYLHGECSTRRTVAETMNSLKRPAQNVLRPAYRPVTATPGAHETQCYAGA